MRIDVQGHSIDKVTSKKNTTEQPVKLTSTVKQDVPMDVKEQDISKEKLQQAVNTVNEFFEISHNELKFVFHDGLEKYFVQLVNSETDEIIREIPPKKLLDVFYEMQKLVGMIVDEKI